MDVQQAIFCWPFSFGGKALHLFAFINPKMPFLFLSCLTPLPLSPSAGSCGLVLHGMYGAEEHHCGCSVSTVTRCCSLSCFVPPLFPSLLHFCPECCVSELCAHCSPGSHCNCCDNTYLSKWRTNLQKAPGCTP